MKNKTIGILLAAGEGTRMKSTLPKVMHPVAGLPMVCHVLTAMKHADVQEINIVLGNQAEEVEATTRAFDPNSKTFIQNERLGTAHAVLSAKQVITGDVEKVLIGYGDTPLVTSALFRSILAALDQGNDVVVLGFHATNPTGYGRLILREDELLAIREEKDANAIEREITFCNSGIMGLSGAHAVRLLEEIGNDNAKGEFYLTDIVEIANKHGLKVRAVEGSEEDTLGVNNKKELSQSEKIFQDRLRLQFMEAGVTLTDPSSCYFSYDTQIGADTLIEPNCFFAPGVRIERGVTIKANSYFEGDLAKNQLVAIKCDAVIGPFARIRPGTVLEAGSKVGNFCEVKNAHIGEKAKVNHLTYIGDAEIGRNANIGAGTITCNYDGFSKFKTVIGAGAFVGSNSALVAPVTIGEGAYVGSGSVITQDVGKNALAVARGRQEEKTGWANHFRNKNQK